MPHFKTLRRLAGQVFEEAIAREAVEAGRTVLRGATGKAGERMTERLFQDRRGHLLTIWAEMGPEKTANLWRRHREAMASDTENRFVELLSKVISGPVPEKKEGGGEQAKGKGRGGKAPAAPGVKPDVRAKAVFEWLNSLEDAEFEQALELLNHDIIAQAIRRIRLKVGDKIEQVLDKLLALAKSGEISEGEMLRKLLLLTSEPFHRVNRAAARAARPSGPLERLVCGIEDWAYNTETDHEVLEGEVINPRDPLELEGGTL